MPGPLLFVLLLALGTASAVATPMAYDSVAGHATTPDSALWGLEKAGESMKLIFTPSPVDKAKFHLALAEERIAEAMASENPETIKTAIKEYIGELAKAMAITEGLNSTELYELVFNATSIHEEQLAMLLDEMLDREEIPSEAKEAIEQAIVESGRGREEALEALEGRGGRP
ncbi:MAG: DUF5667 domain-containing protein [Candidatus Bathyarchaeia archaeon]